MGNRRYFLTFISCLLLVATGRAQSVSFQEADSISASLYSNGQWLRLIDYGKKVLNSGTDFKALRQRLALANFNTGNYSAALANYNKVFESDSYNHTAHYYSLYCNRFLGRDAEASYHAAYADTAFLRTEGITPFGLISAGLETSVKVPDDQLRGTGSYTRVSLANRLGWRVQLEQSVAYYSQSIGTTVGAPTPDGGGLAYRTVFFSDNQFEYYAKLSYTLSKNFTPMGAYHYLHTNFGAENYQNHVGFVGLRYSAPYFSLQGDAQFARISNTNMQQYNGMLTVYPTGSLNLYSATRVSVQTGSVSQTIFGERLGFKLANNWWAEVAGTFGRMDNYLENDGLYVYNAIDVSKLKAGPSLFYQAGKHALLFLNYTFEQKEDFYQTTDYNQHSITGGITWKF